MFSLLSINSRWCVTFEEGFCDIYLNLLPRQICVTNLKKNFLSTHCSNTKQYKNYSSWILLRNLRNFKLMKLLCQLNLNPRHSWFAKAQHNSDPRLYTLLIMNSFLSWTETQNKLIQTTPIIFSSRDTYELKLQ